MGREILWWIWAVIVGAVAAIGVAFMAAIVANFFFLIFVFPIVMGGAAGAAFAYANPLPRTSRRRAVALGMVFAFAVGLMSYGSLLELQYISFRGNVDALGKNAPPALRDASFTDYLALRAAAGSDVRRIGTISGARVQGNPAVGLIAFEWLLTGLGGVIGYRRARAGLV